MTKQRGNNEAGRKSRVQRLKTKYKKYPGTKPASPTNITCLLSKQNCADNINCANNIKVSIYF